ncbi:hypothetical protein KP509_15G020800 [Ceratopteris richardii]|uniref:Calcium-dependent protein kinase n=1 Tax=Ceratopteris richardii TaxID=49495 RepID=A0A8T2T3N3_CERRI|nr:hypothetical protein KP509_15G020800 [Ceratopteris richardii]
MGNCAGIMITPFLTNEISAAEETRVLELPFRDVRNRYIFGTRLSREEHGITYICIDKATEMVYTCRTIPKRRFVTSDQTKKDLLRELDILKRLKGVPSVVQLVDTFEDKHAVHLIMERCSGGELFDRIAAKGKYTEKAAALLCKSIVQAVESLHWKGVMHRDLKPENFYFVDKQDDSQLKVADFSAAVFFKDGDNFTDEVGSTYYIAPEVLNGNYGSEADIWSVGVILYMLLSGQPPFDSKEKIKKFGNGSSEDIWKPISPKAKELVKKMLEPDPKKRIKLQAILSDSWILGGASEQDLGTVLTSMKKFQATNKLKKVALKVIAEGLPKQDITKLRSQFEIMDKSKKGTISYDELKNCLKGLHGVTLADAELNHLLKSADVDNNGYLDYNEFIALTLATNKIEKEDQLVEAFRFFDKDNSGYITRDELENALKENPLMHGESIDDIMAQADTNKDGLISYEEFVTMMQNTGGSALDDAAKASTSKP